MLIAILFLLAAGACAIFLSWKIGLVVLSWYVVCLVGANSPTTFITSKRWLQNVATKAADKAKTLAGGK